MKLLHYILAILLVGMGWVAGWYFHAHFLPSWVADRGSLDTTRPRSERAAGMAAEDSNGSADTSSGLVRVLAQGRLVPKSGLLNIYGPPNQIVESIPVAAGQTIERGQTELATFRLQQRLQLQAELAAAQASDARRELTEKIAVAAAQVSAAELAMALAELQVEQTTESDLLQIPTEQLAAARSKLTRLETLAQDPTTEPYIAANALEQQRLAITEAEIQLRQAEKKQAATLRAARLEQESAQLALAQARATHAALLQVQENPRSIDLSVALAEAAAQEARILAPLNCVVVRVLARPGEVALTMPLMQVADLRQIDCLAEVPDRLVPQLRVGQSATLRSPALPRDLSAKVIEIGRVVGNSSLPDPNPLAIVDRRTIDVRLELAPADAAVAAEWIHLQVSIEF